MCQLRELQAVDLLEQRFEVDDHTIANDRSGVGRENPGRQELQLELFPADHHGVTGVVASVGLDHIVDSGAKQISRLAFSLIAPLGTDDNNGWHERESFRGGC